mgnify:CR=1 FL=1
MYDYGNNTAQGSPPRVRGKGKFHCFVRGNDRITPACAGKSFLVACVSGQHEDHPRMCGEKLREREKDDSQLGSPPHVRGKEFQKNWDALRTRITPACAGKSNAASFAANTSKDHPRMCGEKTGKATTADIKQGSPPRMRGKVFVQLVVQGVIKDHPRVCGEKSGYPQRATFFQGSPPRMRGKAVNRQPKLVNARITPAHAGKSYPVRSR